LQDAVLFAPGDFHIYQWRYIIGAATAEIGIARRQGENDRSAAIIARHSILLILPPLDVPIYGRLSLADVGRYDNLRELRHAS
jgi:hypothetical protein